VQCELRRRFSSGASWIEKPPFIQEEHSTMTVNKERLVMGSQNDGGPLSVEILKDLHDLFGAPGI
jgi:hypothetical protein